MIGRYRKWVIFAGASNISSLFICPECFYAVKEKGAILHVQNGKASVNFTFLSNLSRPTMSESPDHPFFQIAQRLRALARIGITFTKDPYDLERYEEIEILSHRMMHLLADRPVEALKDFFMDVREYPTPKVDVRALVMNAKEEVLLVREGADGLWSLPGGWADTGFSPSEAAVKEIKEETGLDARAVRLLAALDQGKHAHPAYPLAVYKLIVLCEATGGAFQTSFDILDVGYFPLDALPPLSENRILAAQIRELARRVKENILEAWLD